MTGKDAIKHVIEFCDLVTRGYVADLKDEDLLVRPVAGANHVAWQLGHLIASEHQMLAAIGHTPPALPDNFAESHTKETATSDDPDKFWKQAEYVALFDQMKAAALAAVDATPEADLDKPAPESMQAYAPTVAAVLTMLGTHRLMHAGQFVPIRRKLGKPAMY